MTLAAHRPARLVSSLLADDPEELAADLPLLSRGVTLDPQVLSGAACGEQDLELFYPDPDDTVAEQAAKQICAACPVQQPCLEMALATGDQHAILGGTTPNERGRLRRERQEAHARQQAAERATAATGIDPAQIRAPGRRSMAAHLLGDASATVRAWELCKTAGTAHVARLLGVHVTDLHKALTHWGLEVPKLRQPAEILTDPVAAKEAFGLVEQVGWVKAAKQTRVARRTLRAAFDRWGLGEPAPHPGPCAPSPTARDRAAAEEALELAIRVGVQGAAERLGVNRVTLYLAWRRWGLGRPTDRPEGARATAARMLAASGRADRARHPWTLDRSVWQPVRRPSRLSGRRQGRSGDYRPPSGLRRSRE
jgi:WhiB family transcriptional regulator, redox-sensing transcriptional regulator